jgi:hypothetical protein
MDLTMMERVGDRWEKMEGYCSTGQSPQQAAVPVEEEEYACLLQHRSFFLVRLVPADNHILKTPIFKLLILYLVCTNLHFSNMTTQ